LQKFLPTFIVSEERKDKTDLAQKAVDSPLYWGKNCKMPTNLFNSAN